MPCQEGDCTFPSLFPGKLSHYRCSRWEAGSRLMVGSGLFPCWSEQLWGSAMPMLRAVGCAVLYLPRLTPPASFHHPSWPVRGWRAPHVSTNTCEPVGGEFRVESRGNTCRFCPWALLTLCSHWQHVPPVWGWFGGFASCQAHIPTSVGRLSLALQLVVPSSQNDGACRPCNSGAPPGNKLCLPAHPGPFGITATNAGSWDSRWVYSAVLSPHLHLRAVKDNTTNHSWTSLTRKRAILVNTQS